MFLSYLWLIVTLFSSLSILALGPEPEHVSFDSNKSDSSVDTQPRRIKELERGRDISPKDTPQPDKPAKPKDTSVRLKDAINKRYEKTFLFKDTRKQRYQELAKKLPESVQELLIELHQHGIRDIKFQYGDLRAIKNAIEIIQNEPTSFISIIDNKLLTDLKTIQTQLLHTNPSYVSDSQQYTQVDPEAFRSIVAKNIRMDTIANVQFQNLTTLAEQQQRITINTALKQPEILGKVEEDPQVLDLKKHIQDIDKEIDQLSKDNTKNKQNQVQKLKEEKIKIATMLLTHFESLKKETEKQLVPPSDQLVNSKNKEEALQKKKSALLPYLTEQVTEYQEMLSKLTTNSGS